ncbi:hypothetical protein C8R47DRAFT_1209510 [Mycena vitilis]|nr:hypothetical protein C8R47DRAFT_1209510 [Mycena vitilis]
MIRLSAAVPSAALVLAAREYDHSSELTSTIQSVIMMYTTVMKDDEENPNDGSTELLIDHCPRVITSGAKLLILYKRNELTPDSVENLALRDEWQGMDLPTIRQVGAYTSRFILLFSELSFGAQILRQMTMKSGWKTSVHLETLPDGSMHLESEMKLETPAQELVEHNITYPSLPFSDLRPTHSLAQGVYIVETPSHGRKVLKTPKEPDYEPEFVDEVKSILALEDVDFLIRPTHIVLDTANVLRGILLDYHPATSLRHVILSLHPSRKGNDSESPPPETEVSELTVPAIPWPVKLAWATDIAAGVAWLHSQSIFWGDLKFIKAFFVKNDEPCYIRLIDYVPGGYTEGWCPPECAPPGTHEHSAPHDVFGLGLVLWSLAEELTDMEEGMRPSPGWGSETACEWYRQLVDCCLRNERPLAHLVYESLLAHGSSE